MRLLCVCVMLSYPHIENNSVCIKGLFNDNIVNSVSLCDIQRRHGGLTNLVKLKFQCAVKQGSNSETFPVNGE